MCTDKKHVKSRLFIAGILFLGMGIWMGGSWGNAEKTIPSFRFDFEHSAYLRLYHQGDSLSQMVYGYFYPFLVPDISYTDTLILRPGHWVELEFAIHRPQEAFLVTQLGDLPLFLYPGDTLLVIADFSDSSGFRESVQFQGRCADINRYYLARERFFAGRDLVYEAALIANSFIPLQERNSRIDSIGALKLKFLHTYTQKHPLPEWFIQYEHWNITYDLLAGKLVAPIYRKRMLGLNDTLPPNYYVFVDSVPIYNPEAVFCHWYYRFVSSYFYHLIQQEQAYRELTSDAARRYSFERKVEMADSLLKGEIRDAFLVRKTTEYLLATGDKEWLFDFIRRGKLRFTGERFTRFLNRYISVKLTLDKGMEAPDFSGSLPDGRRVHLRDFRGKVVLINFWNPRCYPCLKEIPHERQLVEMLGEKGFVLINVCLDTSRKVWLKALRKFNLVGINLHLNGKETKAVQQKYAIAGYPHYTLVDSRGRVYQNPTRRPSDGIARQIEALLRQSN